MASNLASFDERILLNPSFCSALLWHSAQGHGEHRGAGLPFGLAFLVLPLVLHRRTRESLPRSVATSFATWLGEHPLIRIQYAERARKLVPFTREALLFGCMGSLIEIDQGRIVAKAAMKRRMPAMLRGTSAEVRSCANKATFVGRWFALSGEETTTMALLGVRP